MRTTSAMSSGDAASRTARIRGGLESRSRRRHNLGLTRELRAEPLTPEFAIAAGASNERGRGVAQLRTARLWPRAALGTPVATESPSVRDARGRRAEYAYLKECTTGTSGRIATRLSADARRFSYPAGGRPADCAGARRGGSLRAGRARFGSGCRSRAAPPGLGVALAGITLAGAVCRTSAAANASLCRRGAPDRRITDMATTVPSRRRNGRSSQLAVGGPSRRPGVDARGVGGRRRASAASEARVALWRRRDRRRIVDADRCCAAVACRPSGYRSCGRWRRVVRPA